jgi:hypothetical protein
MNVRSDLRVNENRLLLELAELSNTGRTFERGISRPAFSDADLKAREWLSRKLAGIAARTAILNMTAKTWFRYVRRRLSSEVRGYRNQARHSTSFLAGLGVPNLELLVSLCYLTQILNVIHIVLSQPLARKLE